MYTLQERKRESVLHHDKLIPCHSQEIPLWLRRKRHNLFCDENQVSNLTETSLENADFPDTEQNLTLKEDVEIALDQSKLANDSHSEVVNESSEQETPTAEYPCEICNLEIYDHDSAIQCDGDCDKWFHLSCIDLSTEEFTQFLKTIVFRGFVKIAPQILLNPFA